MVHTTHNGIESFKNQDGHFASVYTKLVTGSTEITDNGVSYHELRDLIKKSFADAELMAQIYQRIANKQLVEEKQELERAEAEALKQIEIAAQAAQEEAAVKFVQAIEQVAEAIEQAVEEDDQEAETAVILVVEETKDAPHHHHQGKHEGAEEGVEAVRG